MSFIKTLASLRRRGSVSDRTRLHTYHRYKTVYDSILAIYPPGGGGGEGDPYWDNVVLLMHMNGTNGAAGFIDQKGHTFTTTVGTPTHSTNKMMFGETSGLFQTDRMDCTSNDFILGTDPFTIEFWINPISLSGNNRHINIGSGPGNGMFSMISSGSTIYAQAYWGGYIQIGAKSIYPNKWHHICYQRVGDVFYFFVDGIPSGSTTIAGMNLSYNIIQMGCISAWGDYSQSYIDEFRITKGIARYPIEGFWPKLSEFPNGAGTETPQAAWDLAVDPDIENVVSLLHFDEEVGSTTTFDRAGKKWSIINGSNIGSTQSKFGNALQGNVTGAAMITPHSADFDLGASDFTIEGWVYLTSYTGSRYLVSRWANPYEWILLYENLGYLAFYYTTDGTSNTGVYSKRTVGYAPFLNQWNHFAVSRHGNTLGIYMNGTRLFYDSNFTATIAATTQPTTLGSDVIIDDFRFTKGVGRYTGEYFFPRRSKYPDYSVEKVDPYFHKVTSLLHFNSDFSDVKGKTWTPSGDVVATDTGYFEGTTSYRGDGASDYITVADHNDWDMQGDFTIEFAFKSDTISTYQVLFMASYTTTFLIFLWGSALRFYYAGGDKIVTGVLQSNRWYHCILQRRCGTFEMFLDGKLINTYVGYFDLAPITYWRLGADADGVNALLGNIAEFRLTRDIARYHKPSIDVPLAFYPDTDLTNVSLLIHLDGTDGATTHTAVTGQELTFNGSAMLKSTQKTYGTSALYLDGGGTSYVTVPSSLDFNVGGGDFTMEFWFYPEAQSVSYPVLIRNSLGWTTNHWEFIYDRLNDNRIKFLTFNQSLDVVSATITNENQWYHVAVTRSSDNYAMYLDGLLVDVGTFSGNVDDGITSRGIQFSEATNNFKGYISDFRLTKGAARYDTPANISVSIPSEPHPDAQGMPNVDPFENNVVHQLDFENTITDEMGYAVTVGAGLPVISGAKRYYGTTSLKFSNVADSYISIAGHSGLDMPDAFCAEFWFNLDTALSATAQVPWARWGNASEAGYLLKFLDTGVTFATANGGYYTTTKTFNWVTPPAINQWHHFAVTRHNGVLKCFYDGVMLGTPQACTDDLTVANTNMVLGMNNQSSSEYFIGHIDDFRLTVGKPRYVGKFQPPLPFGPYAGDPHRSNVVTLFHFEGANNSTTFTDEKGHVFDRGATATVISTANKKFGRSSAKFVTGSSDYIQNTVDSSDFTMGTGDFTVEAWIHPLSIGCIFDLKMNGVGILLYHSGGFWECYSTSSLWVKDEPFVTGVWQHIALVRESGLLRFYINGVQKKTASYATNMTSTRLRIGNSAAGTIRYDGYIDEFRLTKGICRYPGGLTFNVPTARFSL